MQTRSVVEAVDLHVGGQAVRVVRAGWAHEGAEPRWEDSLLQRAVHEPWGFAQLVGVAFQDTAEGPICTFFRPHGRAGWCGIGIAAAAAWWARTVAVEGDGIQVVTPHGPVRVRVQGKRQCPVVEVPLPTPWVWMRPAQPQVAGSQVDLAVGEGVYAFLPSPVPIDLDSVHLGELRARGSSLWADVARWAQPWGPLWGMGWYTLPSRPESPHRLVVLGPHGEMSRAPGFRALGAYAAVLHAHHLLPPAPPLRVQGPAGVDLDVWWASRPQPPSALPRVAVAAQPFVVAFRRFYLDPEDEVGPFLVP
jgi:proline racemase